MLEYLSADIICSEKRTVFQERNIRGQISSIFSRQVETIVFMYVSNSFRNARGFENWGISSPSFSWRIFGHETRLDQSRDVKFLMDYNF